MTLALKTMNVPLLLTLFLACADFSAALDDSPNSNLRGTEDELNQSFRNLEASNPPLPKIGNFLSDLWRLSPSGEAAGQNIGSFDRTYDELASLLRADEDGRVPMDIVSKDGEMDELLEQAGSLGFKVTANCGMMASGTMPIFTLQKLSEIDSLVVAYPVLALVPETKRDFLSADVVDVEETLSGFGFEPGFGSVASEGIFSLNAKKIVFDGKLNVNGHGVTVGVMSDSYDTAVDPLTTAADDIASGDLPSAKDILIMRDLPFPGIDEGRAMMQHIHDLAPKARLAFYTANLGMCTFAQGIKALSAVSDIIVDDIVYPTEPFFQNGIISQAIAKAFKKGITYFSAAGNFGRDSYEGPFKSSGIFGPTGGQLHNFNPDGAVDVRQSVRIEPGARIIMNWDQPYASVSGAPGCANDVNIYLLRGNSLLARGTVNNIGGDPIEIMRPANTETVEAELLIEYVRGPGPSLVKVIMIGGSFLEYQTNSATSFGHLSAEGGAGVGASWWRETPYFGFPEFVLEDNSSAGGIPILFDLDGNRISHPVAPLNPKVVGPDGASNTFFGDIVRRYPHPLFFGTSAAAPHVAGVAALILDKAKQKKKKLYPEDVFAILTKTAIDMNEPGFDFDSGYGHVDAFAAVSKVEGYKVIGRQSAAAEELETEKVGKGGKRGGS